ncbi:hypothetical protein [Neomicrococcus lactis]|uniref:hypothetical protein n=1 Tax=Neomicrococcus lactis TaxID=732241 RepID=UPI0022FFCAD6|nr:hypothetical protein [Neomicrococcus lactis]
MSETTESDYEAWGVKVHTWAGTDVFEACTTLEEGIHRITLPQGPSLDLIIEGSQKLTSWKRIPVFFNGAVPQRSAKKGPFFSGRGLARGGDYGYVSICDPTTSLDGQLGLAWYAGNEYTNLERHIVRCLRVIERLFKKPLLLIGGSGGGFAAIHYASELDSSSIALAWNPQSDILEYNEDAVKSYLRSAFPSLAGSFVDNEYWQDRAREMLTSKAVPHELLSHTAGPENMILFQNSNDWHVSVHCAPLIRAWKLRELENGLHGDGQGRFVVIAKFGEGHASLPAVTLQAAIESLAKYGKTTSEAVNQLRQQPELSQIDPTLIPTDLLPKQKELEAELTLSLARSSSSSLEVSANLRHSNENLGGITYSFFVVDRRGAERTEPYMRSSTRTLQLEEGDSSIGVRLRDGFGGQVCELCQSL